MGIDEALESLNGERHEFRSVEQERGGVSDLTPGPEACDKVVFGGAGREVGEVIAEYDPYEEFGGIVTGWVVASFWPRCCE